MKSYQILVIIGAIVGIPILIVDWKIFAYLYAYYHLETIIPKVWTRPELWIGLIEFYILPFLILGLKIALYVAPLIVTFASKNLSFIGIFLIICSVEILIHPPEYGDIGFPLILAGGIIAVTKGNKPVGKAQLILITIMVLSFSTALVITIVLSPFGTALLMQFSRLIIGLIFVGVIASSIFGIRLAVDKRHKKKSEIK